MAKIETRHEILGGKVQLFKRGDTWYASTTVKGQQIKKTTKEDSLHLAKEVAEDWYMTLRGKSNAGLLKRREKTFNQVANQFESEYEILTEGRRSPHWVRGHKDRLRLHLRPFFGSMGISEVTAGKIQEYRVLRAGQTGRKPPKPKEGEAPKEAKPPSASTIHDEISTLRQVMKTAVRHGYVDHLVDMSVPFSRKTKVSHRAWFSRAEYKSLYTATRKYKDEEAEERYKWAAEQLHDFVLFMCNTGLRPDEAKLLQHRDVTIVTDEATQEVILEIEVRGKTGFGYCKSMPGAVEPYRRLLARAKPVKTGRRVTRARLEKKGLAPALPEPTYPQLKDHLFPGSQTKLLNRILENEDLKFDREGQVRTAYSLRHSYISFRLMEGADIYQIAKNCRTSVEMIEKHYASHIKDRINAAAINMRGRSRATNENLANAQYPEDEEDGGTAVRPLQGSLALPHKGRSPA